jgi:hypothetical protein
MTFKTVLGVAATAALAGAMAPTMASAQAYGAYGNAAPTAAAAPMTTTAPITTPAAAARRSAARAAVWPGPASARRSAAAWPPRAPAPRAPCSAACIGAIAGSAIGRNSAACTQGAPPPPPPPPSYNQGAYNQPYDRRDRGYDDPTYSDSRYGDRRDGYTYESERSYSVTEGQDQPRRRQRLHPGRKPDLPARRPHPEALRPRLPGRLKAAIKSSTRLRFFSFDRLGAADLRVGGFPFAASPSPPRAGVPPGRRRRRSGSGSRP